VEEHVGHFARAAEPIAELKQREEKKKRKWI